MKSILEKSHFDFPTTVARNAAWNYHLAMICLRRDADTHDYRKDMISQLRFKVGYA